MKEKVNYQSEKKLAASWGTKICLCRQSNFDRESWPDMIFWGVGRNRAIKAFLWLTQCNWEWSELKKAGWSAEDTWRGLPYE